MDESYEHPDAEPASGTDVSGSRPGGSARVSDVVPVPGSKGGGSSVRVPGDAVVTGDPEADAVLAGLNRVPDLPVAEHAALYTELHDGLLAALNEELTAEANGMQPAGSQGGPASSGIPGPGAA